MGHAYIILLGKSRHSIEDETGALDSLIPIDVDRYLLAGIRFLLLKRIHPAISCSLIAIIVHIYSFSA